LKNVRMVNNLQEEYKCEIWTFACKIKCTLVTALNQLSHSWAEKQAIRSLDAENNTCASLRVVRDLARSGGAHIRAQYDNTHKKEFKISSWPSLLIVLAESKFCAAEFTIDTNCGQSPTPSIVIIANDGKILWRKIVGSKNEGEKLPLLLRRCPKHSAARAGCYATLPMRAAHELRHSVILNAASHELQSLKEHDDDHGVDETVLDFLVQKARKSNSSFQPRVRTKQLKVSMEIWTWKLLCWTTWHRGKISGNQKIRRNPVWKVENGDIMKNMWNKCKNPAPGIRKP
jgi:hypothetical protein